MKKTLFIVAMVLVMALPVLAQGPFNDVPTDHWAYDAINKLQQDGILIGYPDGTFGGKRAITRYEFAVALARLPLGGGNFVTPDQLSAYAKKSDIPDAADLSKLATKADVDAIRKLVDEFRDELAALGVDVDALKRDVAALCARVEALEVEQRRVKLTGDVNVFAIAESANLGTAVDLDERTTVAGPGGKNTLGRNLGVVRDFDLNVVGRVSNSTSAIATINYGNYLNYIRYIDDYIDGPRPTSKNSPAQGIAGDTLDFVDAFFPYYLYIDSALGKGQFSVGRFPLQFTPYTFKKIDVDSYTTILKTDDGNYPVDGAKLAYNFSGVDVTLYAAKHDENDYMVNGLTGLPNAGLHGSNAKPGYVLHQGVDGDAVGGLDTLITQSAGIRVQAGTPWKGKIGATFYQAWSEDAFFGAGVYDQARVFGFDLAIPISSVTFAGTWNRSDTLAQDGVAVADINEDNTAWDAKLAAGFGKLAVAAGYKNIERNYSAAGAWDKIGRWTNPVNVKGPYLDLSYPISPAVKLVANGEYLKMIDNVNANPLIFGQSDDLLIKAEGGIRWGISKFNSIDLGVQWVRFSPDDNFSATEAYYNIGWAHEISGCAGFKIGYQFINYDDGNSASGPYLGDYRGGLGVVQFGVTF